MPDDSVKPATRPVLDNVLVHGPIPGTLLRFALPIIAASALQSMNGLVNAMWVSRVLGLASLAATSNANLLLFLLLTTSFGVGMAANIFVAQAVGRGDMLQVKRVIGTGASFFIGASVLVGLFGFMFARDILALMQTPPEVQAQANAYLRLIFLATPFMYMFAFVMMVQRGSGDSRTPFIFMMIAMILDVVLNPILMMGVGPLPGLGIAGSAASTILAQGIGLTGMLIHLYRKRSPLLLRRSELHFLKPNFPVLKQLIAKGIPMSLQMLIMAATGLVMITFVNRFGTRTIAAYGAVSQLWTYIQMPAIGLGTAVSSMTAQNVGAGRWDRVSKITTTAVIYGLAITTVVVGMIYGVGDFIMAFFLPGDAAALDVARHINGIATWTFILFSTTFVLFGTVRATGAVIPPLIILIVSMWLIRIPFTSLLLPRYGADAIWWSFPLSGLISNLAAVAYYRYGNWRQEKLLSPSAA